MSYRCSSRNRYAAPTNIDMQWIDERHVSQEDPKTGKPIPAHVDTLWEVEVKTAAPVRNTQATPLSKSIEAVLEVQLLMKGLLDLGRKD